MATAAGIEAAPPAPWKKRKSVSKVEESSGRGNMMVLTWNALKMLSWTSV